jgi:hypothetical protein
MLYAITVHLYVCIIRLLIVDRIGDDFSKNGAAK